MCTCTFIGKYMYNETIIIKLKEFERERERERAVSWITERVGGK